MSLDVYSSLLLPFVGAVVGIVVAMFFPPIKNLGLKLLLSFSGAFLLGITVFELLPDIFSGGNQELSVFLMAGILLQIVLEFFSKGAEHGHFHPPASPTFPLAMWVGLSLHALLEGMPLSQQIELGYGILVHKIPIGILLYLILDKTPVASKWKWMALLLFAVMTPLGSLLMGVLSPLEVYRDQVTALVVGMILHISTTILFESSENHRFNIRKLSVILIAIILAYWI